MQAQTEQTGRPVNHCFDASGELSVGSDPFEAEKHLAGARFPDSVLGISFLAFYSPACLSAHLDLLNVLAAVNS